MVGRLAPVRVGSFGRLLTSYTVNELGDSAGVVALAILVFDRTGAVVPTAAFFVAAKFLPALLAPALTARVDRTQLRRSLPAIYVLEAVVLGVLALQARHGFELALVLALGLLDGCLALTSRALTRGAVAALLQPAGLLKEGNALMNVGFAFSSVAGAALAGVLISEFGLAAALLVDAASFLVIAVVLATASALPQARVENEPWTVRLRAGFRFVRNRRLVRRLLIGQALAMVCFTLITPIEVIYAKRTLGTTSAGFGAFVASWGAGIVIGSIVYLAVRGRSGLALILGSSAAVGLAYLGMAATSALLIACALAVLGGAGNGVQWIAVVTALQEATPVDLQARVSALLESIGAAMPGVGYVLGGAIVAVTSPRTAFAIAGAGVIGLVLAALMTRMSLPVPRQQPDGRSAAST